MHAGPIPAAALPHKRTIKNKRMVLFMNNYKVNNLHINGKVASGIIKGLWYRVTFDFIPTKEEAIKAIRKSASYNN